MRILLIGPLPPPIVGPTTLLRYLAEDLSRDDRVEPQVINTTTRGQFNNWFVVVTVAIRAIWATILNAESADVISFHASCRAMLLLGPILFLVARLFNKPLIVRLFGGAFEKEYEAIGAIRRWVFDRTVLASDVCLLQTKHLVEFFRQRGARRAEWFSNYTRQVDLGQKRRAHERCERFIFLGRVTESKGVGTLLQVVPHLSAGLTVDIYGPLYEPYTAEMINSKGQSKVRYKGVLSTQQIMEILFDYHALVLPTFYEGEGYPGVIVEAYSHGLPVITTRWRGIPEIVDESSGILISPRSPDELAAAMNRLNEDRVLFQRLQRGAIKKSSLFSDQYWTNRFIKLCQEIVR